MEWSRDATRARYRGDRPPTPEQPLAGFVVAVTATRRRQELAEALRRRGAAVIEAPLLRYVNHDDTAQVRGTTLACVARPPDYLVVTTGHGWRGWLQAADRWQLAEPVLAALAGTRILARGPVAASAVRASGLPVAWSPPGEELADVLDWLLREELAGKRVVIVEAGSPCTEFVTRLREREAEVLALSVYRWAPPVSRTSVHRLTRLVLRGEVHAVSFVSAPAVSHLLDVVSRARRDGLVTAFATDVLAACVGPVCAQPFTEREVPVVWPEPARLDPLVELIRVELTARHRRQVTLAGERLTIQGNAVYTDRWATLLSPPCAALLRALLSRPTVALTRDELRARIWPATRVDRHMVDVVVGRLRQALGPYAGLVGTAVGQGYQLLAVPVEAAPFGSGGPGPPSRGALRP